MMIRQRIIRALATGSALLLIGLAVCPIRNTGIKALLVLSAITGWGAFTVLCRQRPCRVLCGIGIFLIIAVVAFWPGRVPEQEKLRADYVRCLEKYRGTHYVWGGENQRGLDCSGLVRAAWIDAQMRRGFEEFNPSLIREACSVWWFDASAQELGNGYGKRTRHILDAPAVRAIDPGRLLAGDLAVVTGGTHILAYLGNGEWIEADPGRQRVIELNVKDRKDRNSWLDARAVVVRWRLLDPSNPNVR